MRQRNGNQGCHQFHSDPILIHISGAASMDVIRHERVGVFYPLFSEDIMNFK